MKENPSSMKSERALSHKRLQAKKRTQKILTLMKNSNNHNVLFVFQTENTVVFA